MRENGVEARDPGAGEKVRVQGNIVDRATMEKARKACGRHMQGGTGGRLSDPETRDRLLRFAACMRKEGVDVPDPDFSGGGARVIMRKPAAGDVERHKKAMDKCDHELPGGGKMRSAG